MARYWQTAAFAISFLNGIVWSAAGEPNDKGPLPQLGQFAIKGLDTRHNKIDQIISRYGFICLKISKLQRPYIIEDKLVAYLKTLPPSHSEIERELTAFGAVCENKGFRLDCAYERQVEKSVGFAGSPEPETIIDEFFRIDFSIVKNVDSLDYAAKFDRKQKVKWRRGWPKGT